MAQFEDRNPPPQKAYGFSGGNWQAHFTKGKCMTDDPKAIEWLRSQGRFREIFEAAGPENAPQEAAVLAPTPVPGLKATSRKAATE